MTILEKYAKEFGLKKEIEFIKDREKAFNRFFPVFAEFKVLKCNMKDSYGNNYQRFKV